MWSSALGALLWWSIVLVVGTGSWVLLMRARLLPFDRRRRLERGRLDLPLSAGSCAVALPVTVRLDPEDAGMLAGLALHEAGVRDVVVLDAWTSAGWRGFTWRSFGQQVGVIVQPTRPGEVLLWCCSRPRISTTLADWGASRRSATQVRDAVLRVASSQPPTVAAH